MTKLTDKQIQAFSEDGYLLIRSLFDQEEIGYLKDQSKRDKALDDHSFSRADREGGKVRLSLWNHAGDNLYGMFARCHRIVDTMEQLLEDEVYHYHSKMILKDPKVGGAWDWHQDYGYWYENGCLYPDMASAFIAVDKATKENGCLQVIKGSHKLGRINHAKNSEQAGADMEHVDAALKVLDLVYVEMEPGDCLFFHANVLHRSDQNRSDNPRWSMICCYNTKHNDPYKPSHHPGYTPLKKVDDKMIKQVGSAGEIVSADNWLNPDDDQSVIEK